jgi:hypothetical protein
MTSDAGPRSERPLVLELVIEGTEPLSGTVAVAGSDSRREFCGWIDLMSAVSLLQDGRQAGPALPDEDASVGVS